MIIEIELPDLEGFEPAEGEQPRKAVEGDYYLNLDDIKSGVAISSRDLWTNSNQSSSAPYFIYKKKEPEYKTSTAGAGNGYVKFVEIKALEDALLLVTTPHDSKYEEELHAKLMELIK